jgi:serine/threonine protein kinase
VAQHTNSSVEATELLRELPGGWTCTRTIARGAFADVYEGTDSAGGPVAIKIPHSKHPQTVPRFLREARVMQAMPSNPHVVTYRGMGEVDGLPFLVMEFVDGAPLQDILDRGEAIEPNAAIEVILQLCDALGGMHKLGISHGDIKPGNVLVRADRTIKLIDFGLVRDSGHVFRAMEEEQLLSGSAFSEELDAGMLMGTPEYLSPEAISDSFATQRSEVRRDTPADVFAIGVLMYQMFTGRRLWPFEPDAGSRAEYIEQAKNYLDARLKIEADDIPRPPEIDNALWSILKRTLQRSPADRQLDALSLYRDLERYNLRGVGVFSPFLNPARILMDGSATGVGSGLIRVVQREVPPQVQRGPEPLPLALFGVIAVVAALALWVFVSY